MKKEKDRASQHAMRETIVSEWLPAAMCMGISKEAFYSLTPAEIEPYARAHEIKEKKRLEEINFLGWLAGIYVTHALGCAFSQNGQYPAEPFGLFGDQIDQQERSRREAAIFEEYAGEFNRRFKRQKEEDK